MGSQSYIVLRQAHVSTHQFSSVSKLQLFPTACDDLTSNRSLPASLVRTSKAISAARPLGTSVKAWCCLLLLQGPLVYGAKVEDRFKPTDKVKVLLASATLMNKPERHMPREQAWNHSLETRIKAGDDDRLAVSTPNCFLRVWLLRARQFTNNGCYWHRSCFNWLGNHARLLCE